MIGRRIGMYELLAPLGRGGQASVYRARESATGRLVALKLLGRTVEGSAVQRFIREAEILARLDHPHIVRLLDVAEADDYLITALQLVDGEDVSGLLDAASEGRRPPLTAKEILSLGRDLLAALDYAHRKGLVHRDVKPANLLVERGGRALLGDFGIARFRELTTMTRSGSTVGTVGYMSPEQLNGQPVDGRSDLYQAGLVLFELAYGEPPFAAKAPYARAWARATTEVPLPEQLPAGLDPSFRDLVRRALAGDRAARFQDAASFFHDLAAVASRSGVVLAPLEGEGPAEPTLVPSRGGRRSAAVALLAAAAAALAVLLVTPTGPWAQAVGQARRELEAGRAVGAARTLGAAVAAGRGATLPPEVLSLLDDLAPRLLDGSEGRRAALQLLEHLGPGAGLRPPAGPALAVAAAGEARALAEAGLTTGALDLLRRAEARGARSREARLLAAELAVAAGAPDEAIASLEACLAAEPDASSARVMLGRLHARRGARGAAEQALRVALRWTPGHRGALLALAEVLATDAAEAKRAEARALLQDERPFEGAPPAERARRLAALARVEAGDGQGDAAYGRASEADRLYPCLETKLALFEAFRTLGEGDSALDCILDALRLSSEDRELLREASRRAACHGATYAEPQLAELERVDGAYAAVLREVRGLAWRLRMGPAPLELANVVELEPFFERLRREWPDDPDVRALSPSAPPDLAEVHALEPTLARLRTQHPDDPVVLTLVGCGRAWAGRLDEAETLARKSLERFPDAGVTWVLLARVARARGDDEAAERAWRRALRSQRNHPEALHALSELLGRAGRHEERLSLLDGAVADRIYDFILRVERADALDALDRSSEALAAYDEVFNMSPDSLVPTPEATDASPLLTPTLATNAVRSTVGLRMVSLCLRRSWSVAGVDALERVLDVAERTPVLDAAAPDACLLAQTRVLLARDLRDLLDEQLPGLSAPAGTPVTGVSDDLAPRVRDLRERAASLAEQLGAKGAPSPAR